jgi:hypothetical protein
MAPRTDSPLDEGVAPVEYEPPRIERLGTLAELTQGGGIAPDDGFGGAGDEGSL